MITRDFKPLEVTYANGSKYEIYRVSNDNAQTLITLLEEIIVKYFELDGATLLMVTNPDIVATFEAICQITPVKKVGGRKNSEQEYLDWEQIKDNLELVTMLFCNSGLNEDRDATPVKPPLLSKINFLSATKWIQKGMELAKEYLES